MPQQERSDEQLLARYECYGHRWDPDDPMCTRQCNMQVRCVRYLATRTLPELATETGQALDALGEIKRQRVYLSAKAVKWLTVVATNPEIGLPARDPNTGELRPTNGIAHPMPAQAEAPEADLGAEPEEALEEEDEDGEALGSEESAVPEPAERPAKGPRKRQGGRKKGARPNPPKARAAAGRPKRAQPKRPQRSAAAGRGKGLPPSSSSPAPTGHRRWGPHTHAQRWTRERLNNPLIGLLPIGSVLTRHWEGRAHLVVCREGYWEYDGERYPTLYSVVEAIAGGREYPAQMRQGRRPEGTRRMAAWSARKFFDLDRKLRQKGLLPEEPVPGGS